MSNDKPISISLDAVSMNSGISIGSHLVTVTVSVVFQTDNRKLNDICNRGRITVDELKELIDDRK